MKHFRKWFVIQKCVLTLVPYPQVVQTLILRFFSPNVDIVIRRPYKDFYPEATILLFWVREEHRNHLQICEITKKRTPSFAKKTQKISSIITINWKFKQYSAKMSMRKKNSIVKAMNDQKEFSLWNTDPVKRSKIQWRSAYTSVSSSSSKDKLISFGTPERCSETPSFYSKRTKKEYSRTELTNTTLDFNIYFSIHKNAFLKFLKIYINPRFLSFEDSFQVKLWK